MPKGSNSYDAMSTEALEALLQHDAALPDSAPRDMDAILEIMEVLARREKETPSGDITDVETAWTRFQADYLPRAGSADTTFQHKCHEAEQENLFTYTPKSRIRKFPAFRIASVAAVLVLCLLTGSATASAFGFDLWDSIVRWTNETFGFLDASEKAKKPDEIPPILLDLREEFMLEGYEYQGAIPSYLPVDYIEGTISSSVSDYCHRIICRITNGSDFIVLQYVFYSEVWDDPIYEIDSLTPETYEVDGIKHYITTNKGTYSALWKTGELECGIHGIKSKDDVYLIIDSIYGG